MVIRNAMPRFAVFTDKELGSARDAGARYSVYSPPRLFRGRRRSPSGPCRDLAGCEEFSARASCVRMPSVEPWKNPTFARADGSGRSNFAGNLRTDNFVSVNPAHAVGLALRSADSRRNVGAVTRIARAASGLGGGALRRIHRARLRNMAHLTCPIVANSPIRSRRHFRATP